MGEEDWFQAPTRAVKTALMAIERTLATAAIANLDCLAARVRGEYSEMPGLQLTVTQACRLWQIDTLTCEMLLEQLVREDFLCKTGKGAYAAATTARREL